MQHPCPVNCRLFIILFFSLKRTKTGNDGRWCRNDLTLTSLNGCVQAVCSKCHKGSLFSTNTSQNCLEQAGFFFFFKRQDSSNRWLSIELPGFYSSVGLQRHSLRNTYLACVTRKAAKSQFWKHQDTWQEHQLWGVFDCSAPPSMGPSGLLPSSKSEGKKQLHELDESKDIHIRYV